MSIQFAAGQYVDHGTDPELDDLPLGAFSVGFWFRRGANSANQFAMAKGFVVPTAGWVALFDDLGAGFGQGRFLAGGSGVPQQFNTNEVIAPLSTWAYIVCASGGYGSDVDIFYGSESLAMVEATYVTSDLGTGSYGSDAASTLRIGGDGTQFCDGRMSRPWVVAGRKLTLTDAEFARRRNIAQLAKAWSDLKLLSPYVSVTDIGDYSGNGNFGTVVGGTTADDPVFPAPPIVVSTAVTTPVMFAARSVRMV